MIQLDDGHYRMRVVEDSEPHAWQYYSVKAMMGALWHKVDALQAECREALAACGYRLTDGRLIKISRNYIRLRELRKQRRFTYVNALISGDDDAVKKIVANAT